MPEMFDPDELKNQADELTQLIDSLRPAPNARLVSRRKMKLLAVLSGDQVLLDLARKADERTLFWEIDGEYLEQRVTLMELPAS